MNRKQLELIQNCDDEHDRKLMAESLNKHNKVMNQGYFLMAFAFLILVGSTIAYELGFDYAAVGFVIAPLMLVLIPIIILRNSGLI